MGGFAGRSRCSDEGMLDTSLPNNFRSILVGSEVEYLAFFDGGGIDVLPVLEEVIPVRTTSKPDVFL